MNHVKLYLVLATILIVSCNAVAQSEDDFYEIPNMIPPSPTAYELGKYGQIPVGYFTGTPNVSIPLFEYKAGKLSVPISLSYNSNGIKVDQLETNVGLGWSLNAGGVISKIVRDEPDEESLYLCPRKDLSSYNIYEDPWIAEFFYNAGQSGADTETDIFMYNFPGGSGKFIFNREKQIITIPHNDLRIEPYRVDDNNTGFQITTSNGVKYLFLESESSFSRTSGVGHLIPDLDVISAWYLSKIIDPNGDEINFVYELNTYSYITAQSQSFQVLIGDYQKVCGQTYYGGSEIPSLVLSHKQTISGKKLVEIKSNNQENGHVLISQEKDHPKVLGYDLINKITLLNKNDSIVESIDLDYYNSIHNRMFLSKIRFLNPEKFYKLEYIDCDDLPERLSFSKDHWGYFNGKTNNYLIPKITDHQAFKYRPYGANREPNWNYAKKGLLKKIFYPTKGYNEFEYEANTYYGQEVIKAPVNTTQLEMTTRSFEMGVHDTLKTISILQGQTARILVNVNFNSYDCDVMEDVGKSKANFTITNLNTGEVIRPYEVRPTGTVVFKDNPTLFVPSENGKYYYVNLKANNLYQLKLDVAFQCIMANASVEYTSDLDTVVDKDIETGGVRIKRLYTYDTVTNQRTIERYYYGEKNGLQQSSGDVGAIPYYINKRSVHVSSNVSDFVDGNAPICDGSVNYWVLSSNSLNSLFNTGNNNIYYRYVTISKGGDNFELGGEEYQYTIDRDVPAHQIYGENYILSAPYSNLGWDHGNLINKITFKKDDTGGFITVNKTHNEYYKDLRFSDYVSGYSVRKNYDPIFSGEIIHQCNAEDTSTYYKRTICIKDHKHFWVHIPFVGETCIGGKVQTEIIPHPCVGLNVGDTIVNAYNLDNLDIMEYKTYSFWHYLKSVCTKEYDENGMNPLINKTEYYYDNPDHLQLTRTKVINSKNDTLITYKYYPHDINDSVLINQNRISEVLETIQCVNSDTINIAKTNYGFYKDLYLPESIKSAINYNELEDRIHFYKYDQRGNMLEVSKDNGMHIVYLWAYGYSLPVAKIENATYEEVMQSLGKPSDDNLSYLQTYSSAQLETEIEKVRTGLLDALVTTYVYTPLVGMTSQIDPNGNRIDYEYDEFGRLLLIRDNEGNVVQKNDYHYKSE